MALGLRAASLLALATLGLPCPSASASALAAEAAEPASSQAKGLRGSGAWPWNATGAPDLRELLLSFAGAAGVAGERLDAIEASIAPTYQALPKNAFGRLSPRGVRFLVHHYFAKEHGWLIAGLEPHGMRDDASQVHEVAILRDRAPELVEELLGQSRLEPGLELREAAALAALVERLLMDEAGIVLGRAYEFNGQALDAPLDEAALHSIISSYLILFHRQNDGMSAEEHALFKELALEDDNDYYASLEEFGQDSVRNFIHDRRSRTNPFLPPKYDFQVASQIVDGVLHQYGRWQNAECQLMKDDLVQLDPHGTGMVPLKRFYSHQSPHGYLFHESIDYLRQIGAVDEFEADNPQVRIANYLLGPSNCVSTSPYLSVCCLSECEALMSELEGHVRRPTASAEELLGLVANLSSASVEAPRALPGALAARLRGLAERHGGEVPLHGRLFAEWLHAAFPLECPYPHIVEDASVLAAAHCDPSRHAISEEEKCSSQEREDGASDIGTLRADGERGVEVGGVEGRAQWSDEEVLPLLDQPSQHGSSLVGDVMRMVILLALVVAVLRSAFGSCSAAAAASLERRLSPGKAGRLGRASLPI